MRELAFGDFRDIARYLGGRKLVLFGGGAILEKTLPRLANAVYRVANNNQNLWGTKDTGIEVVSPELLSEAGPREYYVVICTTSFSDVSKQLEELGFAPSSDFIVSPVLNDLRIIDELESFERKLLFNSGAPAQDSERFGGGLYELEICRDEFEYKKQISGGCHGVIAFEDHFVVIHDEQGIVEVDQSFQTIRSGQVPEGSRAHGVTWSDSTQCFYVACSHRDAILKFDRDLKLQSEISFSHKKETEKVASHHCNDICAVGNSLYVSMFSLTGNWRRNVYDGVVLEIDLDTEQVLGPVIQDLWMPHNVACVEGGLVVLDSLRGQLKMNNAQVAGQFPGFARGLAHDGLYFYIGQSRNRNFSKVLGVSKNISIDAGIIIFDEATKVSRTIPMPPRMSEIHGILALPSQ